MPVLENSDLRIVLLLAVALVMASCSSTWLDRAIVVEEFAGPLPENAMDANFSYRDYAIWTGPALAANKVGDREWRYMTSFKTPHLLGPGEYVFLSKHRIYAVREFPTGSSPNGVAGVIDAMLPPPEFRDDTESRKPRVFHSVTPRTEIVAVEASFVARARLEAGKFYSKATPEFWSVSANNNFKIVELDKAGFFTPSSAKATGSYGYPCSHHSARQKNCVNSQAIAAGYSVCDIETCMDNDTLMGRLGVARVVLNAGRGANITMSSDGVTASYDPPEGLDYLLYTQICPTHGCRYLY